MDKPEVGIIKQSRIKRLLKPTKQQLLIAVGLLAAIVTVSLVLVKISQNSRELSLEESDAQFAEARLNFIKKNQPPENAPIELKIDYHVGIIANKYEIKDYSGAVNEYETLHKLAEGRVLPYSAYKSAALSYAKVGDKSAALAVLGEAQRTTEQAKLSEGDDGSWRADLVEEIKRLKEEISK